MSKSAFGQPVVGKLTTGPAIQGSTRSAMTLIEVILALALTTLVAGLIGGLMNWYVYYQTSSQDRLNRLRTARGVLRMIAADLQGVYRESELDMAALGPLLAGGSGASGGSGGSGASGGTGTSGGTEGMGSPSGSVSSSGRDSGASGGSQSGDMSSGGSAGGASDPNATAGGGATDLSTSAALPPGIYAAASTVQIDLSRVPRPDQYIQLPADITSGVLQDLPHDLKTVTYVVQMPGAMGVADPLGDLTGGSTGVVGGGGLVRRSLSRSVMTQATENGQLDAINRTGDLISPHVVGLLLEFYDGMEWVTTWDSSVQGLPLVVRVTIAIQDQSTPPEMAITPPLDLLTMGAADLQSMNVYLFQKMVPILGAARHNADLGAALSDPLLTGGTNAG